MKKKTRDYVKNVEKACEIARALPICCDCTGPEKTFVMDLWDARERFITRITAGLPKYEVPPTASLFARALQRPWIDCEAAYILPDNRLLILWTDCTEPEVMTEAEYLSQIARECAELAIVDDMEQRNQIIAFFRSHLCPAR